jgi:hypothetical protein
MSVGSAAVRVAPDGGPRTRARPKFPPRIIVRAPARRDAGRRGRIESSPDVGSGKPRGDRTVTSIVDHVQRATTVSLQPMIHDQPRLPQQPQLSAHREATELEKIGKLRRPGRPNREGGDQSTAGWVGEEGDSCPVPKWHGEDTMAGGDQPALISGERTATVARVTSLGR